MSTFPEDLPALEKQLWTWLEDAVPSAQHPFHVLAFSTVHTGDLVLSLPRTRTVVLRHADRTQAEISCHTDLRSEKIVELRENPHVAWHGYDPALKIQLRLEGTSALHHGDEIARAAWERSALSSRRCYTAPRAPGSITSRPESGLPPHLENRVPTEEESETGWPFFAVIVTRLERLEALHLAATGHRRARFTRQENSFAGEWLIP